MFITELSEYGNIKGQTPEAILKKFLAEVEFTQIIDEEPIEIFTLNDYAAASQRILTENESSMPLELEGFPTPIPPFWEWLVIVLQDRDRHVIIITYKFSHGHQAPEQQMETIVHSFRFQE
jgi:hypothetical protein